VLLLHPAVAEAVVALRHADQLVAYVVANAATAIDRGDLRELLRRHLPAYAVPSLFVELQALPLSQHGKVDRRALPEPAASDVATHSYVAPSTVVEEAIADIWRGLLPIESISIHDDFFALGGHSLLAQQLLAQLRQRFGFTLPVALIFEAPVLGQLAAEIEDRLYREVDRLSEEEAQQLIARG
jgi:acyl carrier protein